MPPRRLIRTPYRKQVTGYHCGPASLSMVFSFFRKPSRQRALGRLMKTNGEVGTERRYMIRAATREGFYCYVNDGATFKELKRLIADGIPVIVRFIEPSFGEDHYAVACGYDSRSIILNDPWNGRNFSLSNAAFLARWKDGDGSHEAWLMALGTEDFRLGRQYRPATRQYRKAPRPRAPRG